MRQRRGEQFPGGDLCLGLRVGKEPVAFVAEPVLNVAVAVRGGRDRVHMNQVVGVGVGQRGGRIDVAHFLRGVVDAADGVGIVAQKFDILAKLIVHMRSGGRAGGAHEAQGLPLPHLIALLHNKALHVHIDGVAGAVVVLQDKDISVAPVAEKPLVSLVIGWMVVFAGFRRAGGSTVGSAPHVVTAAVEPDHRAGFRGNDLAPGAVCAVDIKAGMRVGIPPVDQRAGGAGGNRPQVVLRNVRLGRRFRSGRRSGGNRRFRSGRRSGGNRRFRQRGWGNGNRRFRQRSRGCGNGRFRDGGRSDRNRRFRRGLRGCAGGRGCCR